MKIILIAAIGLNRELGKDNTLIWKLSDDLYRFSVMTRDKMVVMGRKTFESIPGPLARREMVVLSKTLVLPEVEVPHAKVCRTIEEVFEYAKSKFKEEVYIIGGAEIYNQFLENADELDLTIIEEVQQEADTYFPQFEHLFYCNQSVEMYDAKQDIKFKFTRWSKK